MKRTSIINLNRFKILEGLRENAIIITLTFLFVIGIILGSLLCGYSDTILNFSKTSLLNFIEIRESSYFFRIFIHSFLSSLIFCGVIFITGTSVVGTILVPLTVFFKGFIYGAACGYLYLEYSLKGIAFNALIYIPSTIIYIFSLIIFSREATCFSLSLAKLFSPSGVSVSIYNKFKIYFTRFLLFLLFVVVSSVVDAILSLRLIVFFNF